MNHTLTIDLRTATVEELQYAAKVIEQELKLLNSVDKDFVYRAINGKSKIEAIKWVRGQYDCGLKEAKDFVEDVCAIFDRSAYVCVVEKNRHWPTLSTPNGTKTFV
jgi:hypothetical protein